MMPSISVISPTRPTNISSATSSLLSSPNRGVRFKLDPTVLNADTHSKVMAKSDVPGSSILMMKTNSNKTPNDITTVALERRMESCDSSRPNTSTRSVLEAFELERILTPEEDAARGLVQLLEFGADMETFRVAPDYYVVKFTVPDKFIGYYANELNLDKEFGLKMLALKRAETLKNCLGVSYVEHNVLNELPENDQIQAGDQLVCYGRYKDFQKFWKAL